MSTIDVSKFGTAASQSRRPPEQQYGWTELVFKRQFVVDRQFQVRKSLLGLCLALVLLTLLNLSLYVVTHMSTEALLQLHPEMRPSLESKDSVQTSLMVLGSLLFVLGVFILGILQSHKTAGAAFSLRRSFKALAEGRYGARSRLRRDDDLHDLAAAFNDLAQTLQDRTRQDLDALQEMVAATYRRSDASAGLLDLKARLLALIDEQRRRLAQ